MSDPKKMLPSDFGLENYLRTIDPKEKEIQELLARHPDKLLKKPTHPDRLMKREILKELRTATMDYEKDFEQGGRLSQFNYGKYGAHPRKEHKKIAEDILQRMKGTTPTGEFMYEPFVSDRVPMQDKVFNTRRDSEVERDFFAPYTSGPEEAAKRGYNVEKDRPKGQSQRLGDTPDMYHYRRNEYYKRMFDYNQKMKKFKRKKARMMRDFNTEMELLERKYAEGKE